MTLIYFRKWGLLSPYLFDELYYRFKRLPTEMCNVYILDRRKGGHIDSLLTEAIQSDTGEVGKLLATMITIDGSNFWRKWRSGESDWTSVIW